VSHKNPGEKRYNCKRTEEKPAGKKNSVALSKPRRRAIMFQEERRERKGLGPRFSQGEKNFSLDEELPRRQQTGEGARCRGKKGKSIKDTCLRKGLEALLSQGGEKRFLSRGEKTCLVSRGTGGVKRKGGRFVDRSREEDPPKKGKKPPPQKNETKTQREGRNCTQSPEKEGVLSRTPQRRRKAPAKLL